MQSTSTAISTTKSPPLALIRAANATFTSMSFDDKNPTSCWLNTDLICDAFSDYGCSGEVLSQLVYPGFSDLTSVYGGDFNDALSSYYCTAT